MELSPLTRRIVGEFITVISQYTPEKIKECAEAEADALKLTEPEIKKRDECVAIIDSAAVKLKDLKEAEGKHAESLKTIADAQKALDARIAETDRKNATEIKRIDGLARAHADDLKQHGIDKKKFADEVAEFKRKEGAFETEKTRFAESKKKAKEQILEAQAKIAEA